MSWFEKFKIILQARDPAQEIVEEIKEVKRGWKTPGFWISLIGSLGALIASLNGIIPPVIALLASTALVTFYNILRGMRKTASGRIHPMWQSTEFWMGVGGNVSNGIISLQQGGINNEYMALTSTVISVGMVVARDLTNLNPRRR